MNLDWLEDALCAQVGTELFFPQKGESPRPAKRACAACPVTAECRKFSDGATAGVFAGETERERRRRRRTDVAA